MPPRPKVTDKVRESIIFEFRAGASKYSLAQKYHLSTATIYKICEKVEQDRAAMVKELLSARYAEMMALASLPNGESERLKRLLDDWSATKGAMLSIISNTALKSAVMAEHIALDKLTDGTLTLTDTEQLARTALAARKTIAPDSAITINNTATAVTNESLEVRFIDAKGDVVSKSQI